MCSRRPSTSTCTPSRLLCWHLDDPAALTVDAVRDWLRDRVLRIPPMRWRVLKIPFGLGRPVFIDAGPVDVDRHLHAEPSAVTRQR